ncbi:MAG: hypothetical protein AB1705_13380 [Verrucomicrobiota bacterium]
MKCIATLSVAFLLLGCKPEPPPASTPAAPAKPSSVPLGAPASDAAPPPPADAPSAAATTPTPEATPTEPDPGDGSVTSYNPDPGLMELQPIVDQYMNDTKRDPVGFEEIVKAGFIKQMPQAPKGKKYVIDQKTYVVKLVNN